MTFRGDAAGNGVIGYKSKKNSHVVDLTKKDYYENQRFLASLFRNDKDTLILEPEEFYILSSKERIRIPVAYAAEMLPYAGKRGTTHSLRRVFDWASATETKAR